MNVYNHLTSKRYICTHTSLPACSQYLFYCIPLYCSKKAPLQRCPRARTDSTTSLPLASQVRAEVDDIAGRPREYAHWRPSLYQEEVQWYWPPPNIPFFPTNVILEHIRVKNGGSHCGIFPSVCSEREGWRLLCVYSIMIHPFVHVSVGRSARHHHGLGVPHLPL